MSNAMLLISFSHWGMYPVFALRVCEDAAGVTHILPEEDFGPGWMPRLYPIAPTPVMPNLCRLLVKMG